MNLTDQDVGQFQQLIEGPLRAHSEKLYPEYMKQYNRFRQRVGPQCAFCKSAAKHIMMAELNRKGIDFITRFKSNDWTNYE